MTDVEGSQLQVLVVVSDSDDPVDVSQTQVLAVVEDQALNIEESQLQVLAVTTGEEPVQTSQLQVLAVTREGEGSQIVRAWGFPLDAHDFYVLALGDGGTLVLDLTTGQWSEWDSEGFGYWRADIGTGWVDMGISALALGQRNNVVCGDALVGQLWLLSSDRGFDEDPDNFTPLPFTRQVIGGLSVRGRETIKSNAVYLTASLGEPTIENGTVELKTSDDGGKNFLSHGVLTVLQDDSTQELAWRSLGLIRAPLRIFEITDNCLARIDDLEML